MKQGKKICETLKAIRSEIASANEIEYTPIKCTHKGDCAGTCPACESETRWLERQLRLRGQGGDHCWRERGIDSGSKCRHTIVAFPRKEKNQTPPARRYRRTNRWLHPSSKTRARVKRLHIQCQR